MVDEAGADTEQAPERASAPDEAPLKLAEFLPYRLHVLASLVSQALSRIYVERYALGVPEWRVLVTLGQFGVMTGKAVGAHSHMHKTKVSRAVCALEERKLLVRRENRADRREAFLSLTPAGRAIYQDLAPGALENQRCIGRRLLLQDLGHDRAAVLGVDIDLAALQRLVRVHRLAQVGTAIHFSP